MTDHDCHTIHREAGRIVIREPASADAGIVCTLHGDMRNEWTEMQALAICNALDRLKRFWENMG